MPEAPYRSSSAARRANSSAGVNRVTAVDINPQFVVVRNMDELNSTIRVVKTGSLPPRCTVYDKAADVAIPVPGVPIGAQTNSRRNGARSGTPTSLVAAKSDAAGLSSQQKPPPQQQPTASASPLPEKNGDTAKHVDLNSNDNTNAKNKNIEEDSDSSTSTATLSSPVRQSACRDHSGTSPLYPSPHAGNPTSGGGTSDAPRKILCIWDVDDTLVASGAAGVRQNLVFPMMELTALFKSLPGARHLLLSQGSIDDVFYPNTGRLRPLQKYFTPELTKSRRAKEKGDDDGGGDGGGGGGGGGGGKRRKKKKSGIFSCGDTKERAPHKPDLATFAKGTALIRLSMVRGCPEAKGEVDFMYDATRKPVLHGESSKDQVRWLVLRPSTWGITLATLNSLFAPSEHTACVDGKIFHKMDVAWSLAKSGLWDSVFFIDNNLSEIGIVRYGMTMSNVLDLQHTHNLYRFFQAEFLLLAASAKLRELERQHGRDVSKPLPGSSPIAPSEARTRLGNRAVSATVGADNLHCGVILVSGNKLSSSSSKSSETNEPSSDSRNPSATASGERKRYTTSGTNDTAAGPAAAAAPSQCEQREHSAAGDDEPTASTLTTAIAQVSSPTAPTTSNSQLGAGGGDRCRHVDLVVAHLHMDMNHYRRMLTGNRSGIDIGARNGDIAKAVGQPTFMGDSSLTDHQYDAVLSLFRTEESALYQLMDEDMRQNGCVEVNALEKWSPKTQYVSAPVYHRPVTLPHMRQFYLRLCEEIETRVVEPLLKGGGSIRGASVIRGDAHIMCTQLLRAGPFLDPFAQGALARELFMIYTAEGNVGKASGEYVHKAIKALLDDPNSRKDNDKKKKA